MGAAALDYSPAGRSCRTHPLPSGSLKNTNDFERPPRPSTHSSPSRCWTGPASTPPSDQLGPGGLDVGDDEHQVLQDPRRHVEHPAAQVDRAAGSGRRQLDEAPPSAKLCVEVHDETELLGLEALRAVHFGDRDRDHFELPVHGAPPFRAAVRPCRTRA
jgi:hypothetical protein